MHCPLDCPYLEEARKREQPPIVDPETFPNKDIRISETFLREHEQLLMFLSVQLLQASFEIPNVVDADVRDALEALVRTYRTLQSGLYYESRPENALAAPICERLQAAVADYRKAMAEQSGVQSIRDVDILGILAFLQRMEIQQRNGRQLGRAFIDFLRLHFPQTAKPESSQLIV